MIFALFGAALAGELLLTGARLWDGTGAPTRPDVDILVRDGRIAAVGADLPVPEGATVLDASGATVLPGLVDAHVHLSLHPGAAWRDDTPAERDTALRHHLRAYLACGVTTILDPAVLPAEQSRIETALAEGTPGPRYLSLGAPFSPAGGYPASAVPGFPTVATAADVEAQLDAVVAQGAVGIKTTVEPGMVADIWRLYTPEVTDAIRAGAAARGLRVYAHAIRPEHQRVAMDRLGATVLVHPPDRPDRRTVAMAAALGVYEMTTLAIEDAWRAAWDPGRLADPWLDRLVPAHELRTARDPAVARAFRTRMIRALLPAIPFPALVGRVGITERTVRQRLARKGRGLRMLADAGVPLLMGSDAGNWPVIPYQLHGPSSVRELELLVEAGFSPAEALVAATRTPSALLGLDAGTVEPGKRADLVVVEGDPLTNISALRTIRWTVRDGAARTPDEWLDGP